MNQNKRQLQKEFTRKRILQSAYQVYSDKGFGATTNMIAKEAQISHGTIFLHFPTAVELQICLLEQFGMEINKQLHQLSEKDDSLEDLLSAHIDVLIKHQNFYKRLIAESSFLPEQARYVYISIQSSVSLHLSQAFEKGQKEGHIKNLSMHLMFNTWLGLLHYYLSNQELFAPEGAVLNQYKEELVHHFINLLKIGEE
ncbi:TetR/AcrR family transcriptional regulator [Clostridium sp. E02]|uniref:TetR/AcrR family transcriptional regulator n=1 Tax=Clostridium sp. E02 TaxID=2487134 RepID=UPI000F51C31E|nr:TetR/AcrR family transcriptional regulator [Clostridium sp. E02]